MLTNLSLKSALSVSGTRGSLGIQREALVSKSVTALIWIRLAISQLSQKYRAYQALAIHERRDICTNAGKERRPDQVLEQVWFPGVH